MTKEDIIRDVAGHYNLQNRSFAKPSFVDGFLRKPSFRLGGCMFSGPEGRRCAFSRFVKPEKLKELCEYTLIDQYASRFDELLRDDIEPRHPGAAVFWGAVQELHDVECYWTDHGLSAAGRLYIKTTFYVEIEDSGVEL
jgi:hypothetical protein|tara:strand:+ start:1272 stop:1688 length:417 start_codon:yes stop_codon:yes gene_type:complete